MKRLWLVCLGGYECYAVCETKRRADMLADELRKKIPYDAHQIYVSREPVIANELWQSPFGS